MKLQLNQSGSWRNVVEFEDSKERTLAVGDAAAELGKAVGGKIGFRLLDDDGDVMGYLSAPFSEWTKPDFGGDR